MSYTIQQISSVISGELLLTNPSANIEHLLVDSRRLVFPSNTLFFALSTERKTGSLYIQELYEKGVRNFVVTKGFDASIIPIANIIFVENTLKALQSLAAYHRKQFKIPVIGITGSNGKTIVKEWLYQLLCDDYNIVRSPKSYNSQIGVPLSVWQMNSEHSLAIFEAGISQTGEMENLEQIIKPTIGVFTNIGEAHGENFDRLKDKALEKAMLFKSAQTIVFSRETLAAAEFSFDEGQQNLFADGVTFFSRSHLAKADVLVLKEESLQASTIITVCTVKDNVEHSIKVPFTDQPSIDNALTCLSVMLAMGYEVTNIRERFNGLLPVEMRMQLKKGVNNCTIINDSYSNDFSSLELSLDYLKHQKGIKKTTAIVSEIEQSGRNISQQLTDIVFKINARNIDRAIIIGQQFFKLKHSTESVDIQLEFYPSTKSFLEEISTNHFNNEVILLKGARSFEFESISHWLEEKTHQTVMEVNLNAMVNNLKEHQKHLKPETKIMAVVKAFSYGSGTAEVANILQFNKVDYLAVAYADEGIELRKSGINMPIMVMNPEPSTFSSLVEYNLEPELYSFNILRLFITHLQHQAITQFPVHLKIDTGMHRLGFEPSEINDLIEVLHNNMVVVKSVFSHLVASENESLDHFTEYQAKEFEKACTKVQSVLKYSFLRHLSNSAAIFRHPHLQYDMVRLGIGLYGVSTPTSNLDLQNVATLKTTIAQIRVVGVGESVGYSRSEILKEKSKIATVRIGYADGYSRKFGNGVGKMFINGQLVPVIGNVCMDMTMLNISQMDNVNEGDEVEVFGSNLPVQEVAKWAKTIPYEIMTGISQRIRRVYYEE